MIALLVNVAYFRGNTIVSGYFMRIITHLMFILYLVIATSCHAPNDISSEWVKSENISPEELHAKTGDFISFKDSTGKYFVGAIVSFTKSEGGIWYAICFTNYYDSILPDSSAIDTLKLNAWKYRYFNLKDYLVSYVVSWARDTLIDAHKVTILGNAGIQANKKVEIGDEGSDRTYSGFMNSFDFYRKERLSPGFSKKDLLDSSLHPELSLNIAELKAAERHNDSLKSKH